MTILALDLGKFNSVACVFSTQSQKALRYQSLTTSPQTLHDLIVQVQPQRVVFETCSIAGWVHDLCESLNIADIQIANPSGEAWKWKNVKRKTDKDDALKLATMSAMQTLPTVWMPSPQGRQLRRFVLHRSAIVHRCTAMKNEIRAILSQQGLESPPAGKAGWTIKSLQQLDTLAKPMDECSVDDLWRGRLYIELSALRMTMKLLAQMEKKLEELGQADERITRLRTVPGVGPRLAETVVAFIGDPHRFDNARQVSAYAGLVPRQHQSGNMDRHGRITRRGPRLLRSMLVEVAWLAVRHNDWAAGIVAQVSKGAKGRRRQAIVALARKLLVRLWAMLRDGTNWKHPTQSTTHGEEGKTPPEGLAGLLRGPEPAV